MRKEYDLKKLKPKKRDVEKSKDLKVAINIRLDAEVVAWLRDEAEKLGLPYQTFLNSKLKQTMSQAQNTLTPEQIRAMIREELEKAS